MFEVNNSGFYGIRLSVNLTNYGILSIQYSAFDALLNNGALVLKVNAEAYILD